MTGQTDCFCNSRIFSKFPGHRQNTSKTAVFDNKTVVINSKERAHNVRPCGNGKPLQNACLCEFSALSVSLPPAFSPSKCHTLPSDYRPAHALPRRSACRSAGSDCRSCPARCRRFSPQAANRSRGASCCARIRRSPDRA